VPLARRKTETSATTSRSSRFSIPTAAPTPDRERPRQPRPVVRAVRPRHRVTGNRLCTAERD
jgi:hypothetical protein